MNTRAVTLIVLATLALMLCFSTVTPSAPNPRPVPVPAASSQPAAPAAVPAAQREPHPEIRQAIVGLRAAKQRMEHAAHDFGGHRVEALRATDEAIRQLELCLKFDRD